MREKKKKKPDLNIIIILFERRAQNFCSLKVGEVTQTAVRMLLVNNNNHHHRDGNMASCRKYDMTRVTPDMMWRHHTNAFILFTPFF